MRGLGLRAILPAVLVARAALAAFVDDPADLCALTADPCVVNQDHVVAAGAVLDLGGRTLQLGARAKLDVGRNPMTILAGGITMASGARILGEGGTLVLTTAQAIQIDAGARVDVSGAAPGRIQLTAGGDVRVGGIVTAQATDSLDGGTVEVRGASASIGRNGALRAAGGSLGVGGYVIVGVAGAFQADGPVDASGGASGGSIEIAAGGVATTAALSVTGGAGSGGATIEITSAGDVAIGGPVNGQAGGTSAAGGGIGATVTIAARGAAVLDGAISVTGEAPAGEGGLVDVSADGDLTQRAAIVSAGRGIDGNGGEVALSAGGTLLLGSIDVVGGTVGGRVRATANGIARLTGTIRAETADLEFGTAGTIEVRACDVDLDSVAVLSAVGARGIVLLQASNQLVVRGMLFAGEANFIEHRDPAVVPIVLGQLSPSAAPTLNDLLPPCGAIRPGSTTTTTLPGGPGGPGGECSGTGLSALDVALCRLSLLRATLESTPPSMLGGKAAVRKLRGKAKRVTRLLEAARRAKKPTRKLRGADRRLAALVRALQRGVDRDKIDDDVGARLLALGRGAAGLVKEALL
jgi:hypothetical protein